MKNAFKKNPALFIGLALPILMMLIFAGIPFVSSFIVSPPRYNFIYSSNYSDEKLRVVDGKLILQAYNSWTSPREVQPLYLVDVQSKKSKKLGFVLAPGEDLLIPAQQNREFIVEGISLKALDPSNQSPDGYQLTVNKDDNFFTLLFFFGGDRENYISLSKNGRIDTFRTLVPGRFQGWIIPQ